MLTEHETADYTDWLKRLENSLNSKHVEPQKKPVDLFQNGGNPKKSKTTKNLILWMAIERFEF